MANPLRGRFTVTLDPCSYRAQGLETIGTVTLAGDVLGLAVDPDGEYFAIGQGKPLQLPRFKVQSAIAALQTGIRPLSQADRMAIKAQRKAGLQGAKDD